jgi:hypothetical protein
MQTSSDNDPLNLPSMPSKSYLEEGRFGQFMIPVFIVLGGALIILALTRLLSTDRTHRDLVLELKSKTFGNRWIAAYELSKVLAQNKIAEEEKPWVLNELIQAYNQSLKDERTRNFIVTAIGSLQMSSSATFLLQAAKDPDPQVVFSSIVSLGNLTPSTFISNDDANLDWTPVLNLLRPQENLNTVVSGKIDEGLVTVAILTLATHRISEAEKWIVPFLQYPSPLNFTAALALTNFRNLAALPVLDQLAEITLIPSSEKITEVVSNQNPTQNRILKNQDNIKNLQLNLLNLYKKNNWDALLPIIKKLSVNSRALDVKTRAREILN